MDGYRCLALILTLTLLPASPAGPIQASMQPDAEPIPPEITRSETLQNVPGADGDWWAAVQKDICRSEYHVTWQERTYLADLPVAYQAPNRAHNLRTYFTSQGIHVIPRVFDGQTPPWEWALALSGYGYTGGVQSAAAATLHVDANRIEYRRGDLTEWYVNDEHGLEQGFTLHAPPLPGQERESEGEGEIVLDLVLSGNLTAASGDDEQSIEFTTSGGVRVLRYGELVVYDAVGRQLPTCLSLFSEKEGKAGMRITFDATAALYPITIDPLTTGLSFTAAWTAEGDQALAYFGTSVSTAGDVNGDGYSDVIVGAYGYDNGQVEGGRAYVYHGTATGLSTSPAWTADSDQDDARFGWSVGTAGDVNGDGYSDVIVGAHWYDNGQTNEGRAYVYHGAATGLSPTPAWIDEGNQDYARFGISVGTAGDVNGDGYSDVIVGAYWYDNGELNEGRAYVYHGAATGLSPSPTWTAESDQADTWFSWSVDTAGDVNGDGYSDVIVGAPYYDNGQLDEGRAFVYHGSSTGLSTTADWTAESDQAGAYFGWSVGTAGDVNGDGCSDVIVGAPFYDNGQTDEGRAYVYHGAVTGLSTSPAWTAESDQDDTWFGYAVGMAGDVNGDGYSDVIAGARNYDNGQTDEGRAYVYHGAATGLSTTAGWTAESDQDWANFGFSVGTAGDVNGDGHSDVIVGAPSYDNGELNEGRAFVYHGSAMGLATSPAWTAESDQDNARFGWSVSTAGDVDGDGYFDVIVGARNYENGQTDEGRAYVYHGSATGLSATADWTAESNQDYARFGVSVGTAGDVNGDGYADVIVGAYNYDGGQTDEGRAYIYHGSATGLSATADWAAESDQVNAWFGRSVGTAGDVDGDGYSDVIVGASYYDNGQTDEGCAYVYHGSATGLSPTAGWTAESDQANAWFGVSVGTAGDVNGDGYGDVIVGAHGYDNGETDEGRAFVYHGSATGLPASPAWTAESDQVDADFGYSVGTAGDVNGDGYSDVIVGATNYSNGQNGEGRAYVYHGSAMGLSTAHTWTAESDQTEALFGRLVGTAGDVNGDGYSDVIVGAYRYDNGQTDEGRAFLYYGNGGDGLHLLPRQARSDGSAPIAHLGMSDSRTAFQLSLVGRMPLGRDDVRLQWQVAPLGMPITATDIISGVSGWTDVLTTGVKISQTVSSLTPGMPYHWRIRLLYHPGNALGQPAGRWLSIPWNGWNETDLRTEPNQPPVADAGSDQSVNTLALVTLDGSGSNDPDGDLPLTYLWTQTSGPAVMLDDPAIVTPTFTAPSDPAVLTFTLVVTDSLGLPDPTPDEVMVTIINQAPVADAGPDQTVETLALVTLDGSGSFDPDGDLPLIYLWTQMGGPPVTFTPNLSITVFTAPADPAAFIFALAVTDSLGLSDPTPDVVGVTVANQPPVADAGPDQVVAPLAPVTLDGSGSFDPDGDLPLIYLWTQTGGPPVAFTPNLSVTTFTAPSDPAVLTFTLVVIDSLDLADPTPDEVVITVSKDNQPPVADAGSDQSVSTLALVTLDGSGSNDPDGDLPLAYLWTQMGGPPVAFTPNLSITTFIAPDDPAVFIFTLAVTDSLGLSDPTPDVVGVTVANQSPVADAGSDQSVSTLAPVTLDGSGSSDPDGDLPLTYLWTQMGGLPVAFTPNLSVTTFSAPSDPTVLTFTLLVIDDLGLPDPTPDEVVVIVEGYCIYLPLVMR